MAPSSGFILFRRLRSSWAVLGLAAVVIATAPSGAGAGSRVSDGQTKSAQAAEYGAGAFVASLGEMVIGVLKAHPESDKKARAGALEEIFKTAFDVKGMARFAAGVYWRRTAPSDRHKYVELFGKYLSHLYAIKFANYHDQRFVIASLRPSDDGVTAVRTLIVSGDKQTPIEFRVRRSGQDYRIFDVYVGGVSQLITERDEFNAVLVHEGMAGLLQRMKASVTSVS